MSIEDLYVHQAKVYPVGISTMFDKQAGHIQGVLLGCTMQGRFTISVTRLDVCTLFDKQAGNVKGVRQGRKVQGGIAVFVPNINICTLFNQQAGNV